MLWNLWFIVRIWPYINQHSWRCQFPSFLQVTYNYWIVNPRMSSGFGGLCLGQPVLSLLWCEPSASSLSVQNLMVPLTTPCWQSIFLTVASVTLSGVNSKFVHLFQLEASGWLLVLVLPLLATLVLMFQRNHFFFFPGWTVIPTSDDSPSTSLTSQGPPRIRSLTLTLIPIRGYWTATCVWGWSAVMRGRK